MTLLYTPTFALLSRIAIHLLYRMHQRKFFCISPYITETDLDLTNGLARSLASTASAGVVNTGIIARAAFQPRCAIPKREEGSTSAFKS